eukprot:1191539-Prorocentrum_minimum.AAC.2
MHAKAHGVARRLGAGGVPHRPEGVAPPSLGEVLEGGAPLEPARLHVVQQRLQEGMRLHRVRVAHLRPRQVWRRNRVALASHASWSRHTGITTFASHSYHRTRITTIASHSHHHSRVTLASPRSRRTRVSLASHSRRRTRVSPGRGHTSRALVDSSFRADAAHLGHVRRRARVTATLRRCCRLLEPSGLYATHHGHVAAGAGDGHIEAAVVRKEPDVRVFVAAHQRQQHRLLLPALRAAARATVHSAPSTKPPRGH